MTGSEGDYKLSQVSQKLSPGSRVLRNWVLKGGISAEMTALEIEHPDGRREKVILRRPGERAFESNPHVAENEFRLLQSLYAAGLAVQRPCMLDASGEVYPTPYLVVEYIEGEMDFNPPNPGEYVLQMAEQLAGVHSLDCSRLDFSFLPGVSCNFDMSFSADPSFEVERIRTVLEAAWPFPQRNAPTLLHGDYWPGNILWREGKLVGRMSSCV